jgi:hypothetical protein
MARFEPQSALMKYFAYRLAIIQVKVGENNEEAWQRHLMEVPDDIYATIKVFNS